MSNRLLSSVFVSVSVLVGCGGSAPPPEAPKTAAAEPEAAPADPAKDESAAEKAPESTGIPTACEKQDNDVCAVPKDFLKRLCGGTFLNVALVMFDKNAPWTHGYLTRKTQAWNAEGGASQNDFLEFDEEVLLLAARMPPKGGMQVSGAGGYQALRWNGACVTLASEEVTMRKPPAPKHPRIEWRYVDDPMREALRKDSTVDQAAVTLKKECHGVSTGDVSKKCEVADGKLVDAIVQYVSSGAELPTPSKLP